MNDLIDKATNEVFKPTFGARSDVESRIAIRLLLLYLCENGVIDGGNYRSFVESVSDNASKMIEDENHPIPMSNNNQEEKDELKDGIRKNLMSFVVHLPVNAKPSDYMPPDNDSDSYVQEYPDYFIFTNKKTGKETKVDK